MAWPARVSPASATTIPTHAVGGGLHVLGHLADPLDLAPGLAREVAHVIGESMYLSDERAGSCSTISSTEAAWRRVARAARIAATSAAVRAAAQTIRTIWTHGSMRVDYRWKLRRIQ
jgi:hypothetical protein